MLSHPQADAVMHRRHDALLAAERRRLTERASAPGEWLSWLTRAHYATRRFAVAARAILPGVRSVDRADSRPGELADGAVISGGRPGPRGVRPGPAHG